MVSPNPHANQIEIADMMMRDVEGTSSAMEPSFLIAPTSQQQNADDNDLNQLQCTFSKRNSMSPLHENIIGGGAATVTSFTGEQSRDYANDGQSLSRERAAYDTAQVS